MIQHVDSFWGERTSMFKSTQLESYNVESLNVLVCKRECVKNAMRIKRDELAMETDLRVKTRMRGSGFASPLNPLLRGVHRDDALHAHRNRDHSGFATPVFKVQLSIPDVLLENI